jgi:LDH2 family malate/lactate/ureidoglycolate dehydrogenase
MALVLPHEGDRVAVDALASVAADLLSSVGMATEDAATMASCLVFAQASGIDSHGLAHLPTYMNAMADGRMNARPVFRFEGARPGARRMDADNGPGVLAAAIAADRAADLADSCGVGVVAVRDSGHFGTASAYVDRILARSKVGLVLSNASPTVAPRGGTLPALGTNPIAAGFPRRTGAPVIIDLATTAGSRARIRKAARLGEAIPLDWALDAAGRPTTDADAALDGSMQALGGGKGTSIALLVELLCVGLSGGVAGTMVRAPQDATAEKSGVSHVFLAFDGDAFGGWDALAGHMERVASGIEAVPAADPDCPVRLPGARAAAARENAARNGIMVSKDLAAAIESAATIVDRAVSATSRRRATQT